MDASAALFIEKISDHQQKFPYVKSSILLEHKLRSKSNEQRIKDMSI